MHFNSHIEFLYFSHILGYFSAFLSVFEPPGTLILLLYLKILSGKLTGQQDISGERAESICQVTRSIVLNVIKATSNLARGKTT